MSVTLRAACVQVRSQNGEDAANLARATPLVAEAAGRGATLIMCPEFLAAGYIYDESIWRSGELRNGRTEAWLCEQAMQHTAYVGATYLEADGDDFYNTFSLAAPSGEIVGRVRKESLPAFEGWYFKSCPLPKVIDTDIGRIAVGICQDNHTARFMRHLCNADFDLLVMPHSAPCVPAGIVKKLTHESLTQIGPFYADAFGVPTLLVNKVGDGGSTPVPIIPRMRMKFDFPGHSAICDSDGRVIEELADAEGVVIGDIHLDAGRKKRPQPASGYWSRKPSMLGRISGAGFTLLELLGKRAYARNRRRGDAARRVTTTS